MACEQLFLDKLRAHGLRLTPQREMILSVLHEIDGLATADEIYARLQSLTSAVDISTVYRTLDLLKGFDIVASVDTGDGELRYELLGLHGPHIHLICQSCGKVVPMAIDQAQAFAARVLAESGFELNVTQLTLNGLCPDCLAAAQEA